MKSCRGRANQILYVSNVSERMSTQVLIPPGAILEASVRDRRCWVDSYVTNYSREG